MEDKKTGKILLAATRLGDDACPENKGEHESISISRKCIATTIDKTRQDKTRPDKTRQDKTRQEGTKD
jgi:hypothetical protein